MTSDPANSNFDTGAVFLASRLDLLRERARAGERCMVVFDLDNTLFDTRSRTLHVARAYDRARDTSTFASLTLAAVGRNGKETCERLGGVPPNVALSFAAWWEVEFWRGTNFVQDGHMLPTLGWVERAHEAGAEVRFLTGRVEALREVTMQQLLSAGLYWAQDRVWMKPELATWTLDYKAARLREARGQAWLGWYLTEGRAEVAHLQRELPGGPWVLLACSLEGDTPALADDTPTLRGLF